MDGLKRVVVGLLCITGGFYLYTLEYFRTALMVLIKVVLGSFGLILILIGLILLVMGISKLK
jgi:hypothetical protein